MKGGNRFASFKPAVEAQQIQSQSKGSSGMGKQQVQQPQKSSVVKAVTEKYDPKIDPAKYSQVSTGAFEGDYEVVTDKVKPGGRAARKEHDNKPRGHHVDTEGTGGKFKKRFEGKPREEAHPMDKKSGTGRGRGDKRSGRGRGNWGGAQGERLQEQRVAVASATLDEETKEEPVPLDANAQATTDDAAPVKEVQAAPEETPVEEEDTSMTLDEFLASKKTANLKRNQIRETEKLSQKNVEENKHTKVHQVTREAQLADAEVYNPLRSENVELLGFQGGADDDDMYKKQRTKGGRKHRAPRKGGNTLAVNDEEFPAFGS